MSVPAFAADTSNATDGIVSTQTVVLENTPTLKKEQTTTIYSDGIQAVEVSTTTNPNAMLRKNSGTANVSHFVTFSKTSDNVKIAELDMDTTFTYDGNTNKVSCTHKSFSVTPFNGWKASNKSISASTPSGVRKKIKVTGQFTIKSPAGNFGSASYSVNSWIACTSDGTTSKSPSSVDRT